MTIDPASVRVTAAMTPALPLELPADGECPRIEVHELPSQPERLALPQPKCQSHAPPGAVPASRGQSHDPLGLPGGQRFDLAQGNGWGIDQGRNVPGNVAALESDLERAGQDAVNLEHGGRCETFSSRRV